VNRPVIVHWRARLSYGALGMESYRQGLSKVIVILVAHLCNHGHIIQLIFERFDGSQKLVPNPNGLLLRPTIEPPIKAPLYAIVRNLDGCNHNKCVPGPIYPPHFGSSCLIPVTWS
jgi:hypothetical protein